MIIYGRAMGLAKQPELIDDWLSVVSDRLLVNSGFDSGDEEILRNGVVKATSVAESLVELNRQAVRRIKESGAHLHYSMIFGSPGESRESCERTYEFVEWSCQTLGQQLDVCETDVWWLNFGSPCSRVFYDYEYARSLAALAGKAISQDEWWRDFASHDQELVVPLETERAWYHHFTNITYEEAQSYNDRVAERMAAHTGSIRGRAFKPSRT